MEKYIVSARKYRPSTFASVVGQQALTGTLKNAIATDRLAHAYLFCGSRGVGKTSCARIFAKTINCTNRTPDGEACNECPSCREFNENRSFNIIELDAASNNGVDDMRALTEQVMVPPSDGRYRVFIVDEVHMLSSAAFNAFLKTLEEPPAHAVFILATTEKHKIIPTILSRCQIFDFNRISVADMVGHLQRVAEAENITADPAALTVIARKADGAMRDALSIFDQVAASSRGNITYQSAIDNLNELDHAYYSRLVDAFAAGDVPAALLTYKDIRDRGFDSQFFVNGLAQYLRDLMVAANPQTRSLLEADDAMRDQLAATAAKCTPQFIYTALDLLNTANLNYRASGNKQLLVELTLIKLCQRCSPSPDSTAGSGEGLQKLKPLAAASGRHPAPEETTDRPQPPAPPAPPAPTAKPAPHATPPAPEHKRRVLLHTPSVSIRSTHKAQAHDNTSSEPAQSTRRETYTPAAVAAGWQSFIDGCKGRQVLATVMAAVRPEPVGADRWRLTFSNPAQQEVMTEALDDVLTHMRDTLRNDAFCLEMTVADGEPTPEIWSRSELLSHMVEDSADFRNFIKEFRLTLD